MTDTTLGSLYSESGVNAMDQSLIRHYASRLDALARFNADKAYWQKTAVGTPNREATLAWFADSNNQVSVPALPAGWTVVGSRNYRAELDPTTGAPAGSYGYMLFTRADLPNVLFRVNPGTDAEGHGFPLGVLSGTDGDANYAMANGKVDDYLIQFARETKAILTKSDFAGMTLIDLNESMSGATAPLGASIAAALGRDYQAFTYNGLNMSGSLASSLNAQITNAQSPLRIALGGTVIQQFTTSIVQFGDVLASVPIGTPNQHYLINEQDVVGNTFHVVLNSTVHNIDSPISFSDFFFQKLAVALDQAGLGNLSLTPEEMEAKKNAIILVTAKSAAEEYSVLTHVSEVLGGSRYGGDIGTVFHNSGPAYFSSDAIVHEGAPSNFSNNVGNLTGVTVSFVRALEFSTSIAAQVLQVANDLLNSIGAGLIYPPATLQLVNKEFRSNIEVNSVEAGINLLEAASVLGLPDITMIINGGGSVSWDPNLGITTFTGVNASNVFSAANNLGAIVPRPNFLNGVVAVQEDAQTPPDLYISGDPASEARLDALLATSHLPSPNSNFNPLSAVTTLNIDGSGQVSLGDQVIRGNAPQLIADYTGLSAASINQGNSLLYSPTRNHTLVSAPIVLNSALLSGTTAGRMLINDSLANISVPVTSGIYANFANIASTVTLNPLSGLLNLGNSIWLGTVLNLPIGAFYEGGTLPYDEAASIADQTPRLFNDSTPVEANQLTSLDTNSDGVINASDTGFADLNVWEDSNEDGIVDSGEMKTLAEAGIASILMNSSALAYVAGNGRSVVPQDMVALETSLQVSDPTASTPTIEFDYYRNTFNQVRAVDNHTWLSTEVKVTDDGQYAIGTTGADIISTGSIPNILGGDGNDQLKSYWHNNEMWGNNGDDTLLGSLGGDTLIGGAGNDNLHGLYATDADEFTTVGAGESDNDLLFGGAGDDTLSGESGNDTISGDDGNDFIHGFTGETNPISGPRSTLGEYETDADLLYGGAGTDTVFGGVGDDTMSGGSGDDLLVGFYGLDASSTPDAKHTLVGSETDNDLMFGGDGNDRMFGEVGNDTIFGDAGNDLIIGFTAFNDSKKTLDAGESDDDLISGGTGNDTILSGTGNDEVYGDSGDDLIFGYVSPDNNGYLIPPGETENDTLWGGEGNDQLQGQQGDDFLLGGAGEDLLFGQVGSDTIYGQDGDDVLVGFTGYNESKQTLTESEEDNDFLYGGAGDDTLIGGLGNDYLDGGASADSMEGGDGNDIYVVNTINDVVLERASGGTDTVMSSVNLLLSTQIENLYLLGSGDLSGSGNKLANQIYGTTGDNILDGETGADTMVGYAGDDIYYVDNIGDVITEAASEGTDTVDSSISWTLGANQENLTLLSYKNPERGVIDGNNVLVYGYPKRYELDYTQGDAVEDFRGTCALAAISNVITQSGGDVSEADVVNYAIANSLVVTGSTSFDNGGSTLESQTAILEHFGFEVEFSLGLNFVDAAAKIKNGQGVMLAVNAGVLWDDAAYVGDGDRNHVITLTGVVYSSDNTRIVGFYIADSGRGLVSDMTRYLSYADLFAAANVPNGYMIYTTEAMKLWNVNINGTGNSLDNVISGTEGSNVIDGGSGADSLVGGDGNDTYQVDNAGDLVFENQNEGVDTVVSSISFTIVDNIENLTLTGNGAINGTGNSAANIITGNTGANILDGAGGNDTLIGGAGDDAYIVGASGAVITENSNEGVDTVQSSASYALGSNLENLTLTGTDAIAGTGNSLNNVIVSNGAANTLAGGLGNDTFIVSNSNVVITENAAEGTDIVQSSVSYTLAANVENLTLTGSAALAGGGNSLDNTITGNSGADTLSGGAGSDTYVIQNAGTVIVENASEGTDTVLSSVSHTLSANVENLTLSGSANLNGTGNSSNNVITGNSGNNILDGGAGSDTLIGGTGDDTYVVDDSSDVVTENASEGTDTIQSSVSYTLSSNVENLSLAGSGSIAGTGNALNNALSDNSGTSTLSGGLGNDSYTVSNSATVIVENAAAGTDSVSSSVSYTLSANIENLTFTGTAGLTGEGNAQNNYITGNSGANSLVGAGGNDTIDGGSGTDSMSGGAGDDLYFVDSNIDAITENASEGTDSVSSSVSYTLSANVENLTLTGISNLTGTGNTQDNYITGNSGANTLTGAGGNDTLDGGSGADSMVGGTGDDTYYVDSVSDAVVENASEGTDTVVSSITYTISSNLENLTLSGSSNINGVGNSGNNTLTGNSENNSLDGSTGNDTMAGGAGSDTYTVDASTDVVNENANEGTDTVNSSATFTLSSNVENLTLTGGSTINGTGNSLDNSIIGNTVNNSLTGAAGNDTIDGGTGSDTMVGGTGNDVYYINVATDVITENASEGIDTVMDGSISYTLGSNVENLTLTGAVQLFGTGNALDNFLIGNISANSLVGADGNDTLDGGVGGDTLVGGLGDDVFYVDNAADVVVESASQGFDTEVASVTATANTNVENLTLTGSSHINATGNASNNVITGNTGNNSIDGSTGTDTLIGGLGDDTYVVDSTTDTITENVGEGTDLVKSSVTYTLGSNLENLTLTGAVINGTGNSLDNYVIGTGYNNSLVGAAGNDTLDAGAGGVDTLVGGTGDDTYIVNYALDVITENSGEGTDTVASSVTFTLSANVEKLTLTGGAINTYGTGNSLDNVITGNAGANSITGGAGADTMIGGSGGDTYVVDDANDVVTENLNEGTDAVQASVSYTLSANVENITLTGASSINATGNSLNNTITGNSGNNIIDGGAGVDTMTGGTGNDTYYVDSTTDVISETSTLTTEIDTVNSSITYVAVGGVYIENINLLGSANLDVTGNSLNNYIKGNSGNNNLNPLTGNDTLEGGAGNDIYTIDSATLDTVIENADEGTDTVKSSVSYTLLDNFENLTLTGTTISGTGNAADNYIIGSAYNNALVGLGGNDTLDNGGGADTMTGGTGNDVYYMTGAVSSIVESASEGTDSVFSALTYTLASNVENLSLTGVTAINGFGNSMDNVLTGNTAANSLDGGAGADTMTGGLGNDIYVVDNANDVVVELSAQGTDTISSSISLSLSTIDDVENLTLTGTSSINGSGNTSNNVITGNSGDNVLLGGAGNDTLSGGNGQNTLDGGLGNDSMTGGTGNDSYYVDSTGDVVNETAGGSDTVFSTINYTLGGNLETLILIGDNNVTATGNAGNNVIIGNEFNNTLDGSSGSDTMRGGLGNDTYVIDVVGDNVSEDVGGGTDTVRSLLSNYTLGANFENLTLTNAGIVQAGTGNSLDNYLTGTAAGNTLIGAAGNDTLDGGAATDSMVGGTGDDVYFVDSATDVVVENASEGTDTVNSSITYTISANFENLTLTGSSVIHATGNALNNIITGNGAANSLTGGAGNDTLSGGAGTDTMIGGTGDDVYVADASTDVVTENASEGTDTVNASATYTLATNVENLVLTGVSSINGTGNSLDNVLTGNSAANSLSGAAGNDSLIGGDGNDSLDGGTGNDTMLGGIGNDAYTVDSTTDVITENASEGTDTVNSSLTWTLGSNLENLTLTGSSNINGVGNTLNNVITGNTGTNSLSGGDGDDSLDGGAGIDTLIGGLGNDSYYVDSATDSIVESASEGIDTAYSSATYTLASNVENLTLTGASGIHGTGNTLDNYLTGNTGANSLSGSDGNDTLDGGSGTDTLIGGIGNDLYIVDASTDVITESAGEGTDAVNSSATYTLSANVENLTLTGSSAINGTGNTLDNYITGNSGNNSLTGSDGNDTLDGGLGNDSMVGGVGNDTYIVDVIGDALIENASEGTDTVLAGLTWTLGSNFENLVLMGTSAFMGRGNSLDNYITGNSASNTLTGDAGNDTLDGGLGNDSMVGGTGNDSYFVDSTTDLVTENSGEGTDLVTSTISWSLGTNIENLTLSGLAAINAAGNSADNVITGNNAANILFSDAGNDSLLGGGGFDTLDGGTGNDTMAGGTGNDTYFVDSVNDVVTENASEGTDTVNASVTYSLASNIENLTLLGSDDIDGTGNSLDNRILGSAGDNSLVGGAGNDTLNGEEGADTMLGGSGDDIYYVDSVSDVVSENSGEGTDTIYSAVNWTLDAYSENLILTGRNDLTGAGNALNNAITGGKGNDTLSGDDGDDTLDGGLGDDSMVGAAGNDVYFVNSTGDVVIENASEGTDLVNSSLSYTLASNFENLTLTGSADINGTGNSTANVMTGNIGANYLSGADGDDSIASSDGNDTLDGGLGADTLVGGIGDDVYYINSSSDVVTEDADSGTDMVYSSLSWTLVANVENLTLQGSSTITGTGNGLDNVIIGNLASNLLTGGGGNDMLADGNGNVTAPGALGTDTLIGGIGDDTYLISNASDVITENAAEGADTVVSAIDYTLGANLENLTLSGYGITYLSGTGNSVDNIITGDRGDNTLYGAAGNDSLVGGLGNDSLDGGTGNDTLVGGVGNDIYIVDSATDVVSEASYFEGLDIVQSSVSWTLGSYVENLTLTGSGNISGYGNSEDNVLFGNSGNNTLSGGFGSDTLNGYGGADNLQGGWGDDLYYVDGSVTIVENSGEGADSVISSVNHTLAANVENLSLTGTATVGVGNELDNIIIGNASGNNSLSGGDGNDYLVGGSGNDSLDGGAGNDTLVGGGGGGDGDDTYYWNGGSSELLIIENENGGNDTVSSSVDLVLPEGFVENLTITGSAVYATGNSLDNVITGNSGNNVLSGGAGNDTFSGGAGSDTYVGGTGNDTYYWETVGDAFNENANEGTDTIVLAIASVGTVTLAEGLNVENLILQDVTGSSTVTGNSLNNALTGNIYANSLVGGAGNDTLDGGLGVVTDYLLGGTGDDVYILGGTVNDNDYITENASEGTDTVMAAYTYTLGSNVENLTITGSLAINGTGNTLDNVLTGNTGANSLSGSSGNDSLVAGGGSDTLDGGTGNDTMLGGTGNDVYFLDVSTDVITENASEGTDTVNTGITYTLGSNVENLTLTGASAVNGTGNTLDNWLIGNSAANSLVGAAGNDTLDGGAGVDTLVGGTGNDSYTVDSSTDVITENSSEGTDTVNSSVTFTLATNVENLTLTGASAINGIGTSADNVMVGNAGSNSLSGAAGNDTYVIGVGGGTDTIADSSGTADIVSFDSSVAKAAVAFYMNGNDLQIGYVGSSDIATVQSQAVSGQSVEKFMLSDGDYLSDSDINTIIQQMSTYATNNSIAFTSLNDVKANSDLMNIISTSWHA